jgi:HEAT repeat protein
LTVLRQLIAMPDEAVPAIAAAVQDVKSETHRRELIEILGRIPVQSSADLLVEILENGNAGERSVAIRSLRLLAARIRRSGVVRVPVGPDFPPKIDGLVPYLVAAADDEDTGVRWLALWALADTRDPAAADKLRDCLRDPDPEYRFIAACLLTEFDDASGLPELRNALTRLRDPSQKHDPRYYAEAQHLAASFQRITGQDMGEIPGLPMVHSSITASREAEVRLDELMELWDGWWTATDTGP